MLFEFLTLGFGALKEKIKNDNHYANGKRILEEQSKQTVWQQAREHPLSITINEKFWESGLPLDDFLIKFYEDNHKCFLTGFIRMIDKKGNEKVVDSLYVSDLYYNSLKKK